MAKRRGLGDQGLIRIRELMEQATADLKPAPPDDPTTFVKQKVLTYTFRQDMISVLTL